MTYPPGSPDPYRSPDPYGQSDPYGSPGAYGSPSPSGAPGQFGPPRQQQQAGPFGQQQEQQQQHSGQPAPHSYGQSTPYSYDQSAPYSYDQSARAQAGSAAYSPPQYPVPGTQPGSSRSRPGGKKVGGVGFLGGLMLAFSGFRVLYSVVGTLVVLGALGYGGYVAFVETTGTKPGGTYTEKGTLVGSDATKGKVGDCAKDANDATDTDKTVITKCTDPAAKYKIVGLTSGSKLSVQRDDVCKRFPKSDIAYARVPEGATSSVTAVTVACMAEQKAKQKKNKSN